MECKYCGMLINDDSKYCCHCGKNNIKLPMSQKLRNKIKRWHIAILSTIIVIVSLTISIELNIDNIYGNSTTYQDKVQRFFYWTSPNFIIPNHATEISNAAFKGCNRLKNITIPGDIKINYEAFANCKNLESITIEGPVSHIDKHVFANCHSLKIINFKIELPCEYINIEIDNNTFDNCHNIENISLGNIKFNFDINTAHNIDPIDRNLIKFGISYFYSKENPDFIRWKIRNEEKFYAHRLSYSDIERLYIDRILIERYGREIYNSLSHDELIQKFKTEILNNYIEKLYNNVNQRRLVEDNLSNSAKWNLVRLHLTISDCKYLNNSHKKDI